MLSPIENEHKNLVHRKELLANMPRELRFNSAKDYINLV
jgi:hypothetical protein